ncbi:unnamed protein product, partial [Discosporangium mesarthrocarpum]
MTIVDKNSRVSDMTITASSSDPSIIPNENIEFDAGLPPGYIFDIDTGLHYLQADTGLQYLQAKITPLKAGGPVTITVTVSDGIGTSTSSFDVSATPRYEPTDQGFSGVIPVTLDPERIQWVVETANVGDTIETANESGDVDDSPTEVTAAPKTSPPE